MLRFRFDGQCVVICALIVLFELQIGADCAGLRKFHTCRNIAAAGFFRAHNHMSATAFALDEREWLTFELWSEFLMYAYLEPGDA